MYFILIERQLGAVAEIPAKVDIEAGVIGYGTP